MHDKNCFGANSLGYFQVQPQLWVHLHVVTRKKTVLFIKQKLKAKVSTREGNIHREWLLCSYEGNKNFQANVPCEWYSYFKLVLHAPHDRFFQFTQRELVSTTVPCTFTYVTAVPVTSHLYRDDNLILFSILAQRKRRVVLQC